MEGANNRVAELASCHPLANGRNLTRAVGKRYDAKFCRAATAAFEDHQISVVKRARADPHEDLGG
jgi:hypothetical protein